jgi:malonate-semialdehyde dehydrogenase (acetylating)/methylmalonate-semialdehyde dehydrogenase
MAVGNAFILKPSERDPSVPNRLAELFMEAGCLKASSRSCMATRKWSTRSSIIPPSARSASLARQTSRIMSINRGVAAGKRVQAMGGAKNHGIVMPDADLDQVVNDLTGAAFGSAGERCMALPSWCRWAMTQQRN